MFENAFNILRVSTKGLKNTWKMVLRDRHQWGRFKEGDYSDITKVLRNQINRLKEGKVSGVLGGLSVQLRQD